MAARRREMDIDRIRHAVNGRLDQFRSEGRELQNEELRRRMADVRGGTTSIKMVDLLVNDRPKKFFETSILRAASRALEWPDDALERIEAGEVDWENLPHLEWPYASTGDVADDGALRRMADVEDRIVELEAHHQELTRAVTDLANQVDQLSQLLLAHPDHPRPDLGEPAHVLEEDERRHAESER